MANLNQSLNEGVCIDEEVFFGPVTDTERKIRKNFENACCRSENKPAESCKAVENDISKNDSFYKSFSVDESKYDSFDDSLNDYMPHETKHVTLRKSFDKLKSKRHGFYDSLEDVCSLVSNIDKCSISCEVENDSNFNNKQHIIEDSLKNPLAAVANKSHVVSEQVHFDDDSLAIIEYENTFDDSLEEINVLESIEVEEIDDIENVVMETQNVAIKVEQNFTCAPRNLFDTSVQIICEKKKNSDTADQEESSGEKNMLYDSLSNSDFKDILKDSLEESEKQSENLNLLKNGSAVSSVITAEPKQNFVNQNTLDTSFEKQRENCNLLKNVADVTSVTDMKPENIFTNQNTLDTICEKKKNSDTADHEESSGEKNMLYDSLSNSDFKDISKDSLEESEKQSENLNLLKNGSAVTSVITAEPKKNFVNQNTLDTPFEKQSENCNLFTPFEKQSENCNLLKNVADVTSVTDMKPENIFANQNTLDTSVQIIYENLHNFNNIESISEKSSSDYYETNSDYISKDSLENSKEMYKNPVEDSLKNSKEMYTNPIEDSLENSEDMYKNPVEEMKINTSNDLSLQYTCINTVLYNQAITTTQNTSENSPVHTDSYKNELCSDSNANEDSKMMQNKSVIIEPVTPFSAPDNSNLQKETISVDSCHLKILNDSKNINEDMKFQLHIEVSVGDKKCHIASQDIKLTPATILKSKDEIDCVSTIPIEDSLSSPVSCTAKFVNVEKLPNTLHFSSPELSTKNKGCDVSVETISRETNSNEQPHRKSEIADKSNITQRAKTSTSRLLGYSNMKFDFPGNLSDISLLQALDLHDISSFLNESIIQSEDSLMPLNLCSKDKNVQNFHGSIFRNESKENVPEQLHFEKKKLYDNSKKISPFKVYSPKTPKMLQKCSSFKETTKKTPGTSTKIPVRKIENFAVPIAASSKLAKQVPPPLSAEKVKKCQQSPHSADGKKKTPGTTPNKTHHFCKVRNTIFSKVPQIVPSKKYMNIESPVAQYIRNNTTPVKTPVDQVLHDCMNRPVESPYHLYQTPKGGPLKPSKKKA